MFFDIVVFGGAIAGFIDSAITRQPVGAVLGLTLLLIQAARVIRNRRYLYF